jgi:hypothetical protein
MTRPQKPQKSQKSQSPKSQKRASKPTLLLTAGVAALLVGGGTAALMYFLNQGVAPGDMPVGANVVPQDAIAIISLTTDGEQWQKLREFGTPQSQAALDKYLVQTRDRLLTANNLNYEQDIKPWVGNEITFASLNSVAKSSAQLPLPGSSPSVPTPSPNISPSALPASSLQNQQSTVVVLPIRDALKAKEILEKPRSQAGTVTERVYQEVPIRETKSAQQSYSFAVLDGKLLVVTNDPKAMERAIDTYKGAPSLAAVPGYSQSLAKVKTAPTFGKLYINFPVAAVAHPRYFNPQAIAAQQIQGVASNINLESEGIRFKSIYWLKPESQRQREVQNNARDIASRLPDDTLLMVSGGSFQRFWRDDSQGSMASLFMLINPQALEQGIQSTVKMDLQKDFLSWMDGEFSLALVATPENTEPTVIPYSFVLMVKAQDRRAAEASLKRLDQAMTDRYKLKVEESKVANQSVVNWSLPLAGPTVTHGWLDGDIAFLSLGAPLAPSLIPRPAQALADSDSFKKSVPTNPNPNNGHFYVNVERAIAAKNLPMLQFPPGNRDLLAAIRYLGVTAADSDSRSVQFDILTVLHKGNVPAPLPAPTIPSALPVPGASPTPVPGNSPGLDIPAQPLPSPN